MFISALGGEDGMNGWEKNGNQFKIESYVTLYFSAAEHTVGCFVLKSWIFSMLTLLDKLLFSFSFSQQMRWTSEHDVMFLREVLVHEPWKQKYGSQERGKVWEKIAESLNGLNTVCELYFKVTQRSVRDRYISYSLTILKNVSEKKLQQVEFLQRKQRVTLLWPT